uniref:Uncharacterized protein n=1 Tax=Brassica campestris TaxID=3711 RepID=A0A3P6D462_BRACM|nr:unnamed protein product [Brassica rapa]
MMKSGEFLSMTTTSLVFFPNYPGNIFFSKDNHSELARRL